VFRIIGDLLDIFERGDMRTELLKELERQQQKLRAWLDVPGVDAQTVSSLRDRLKQQSTELMAAPRMGQQLREDRLIALVRQRLSIPGGCCSFDLPSLHIWLHQQQSLRDMQVNSWLESLDPLRNSLNMILDLVRQSGVFRHQTSLNGFYQDNAEGSDLLRLQLTLEDALYPQISGHKSRYAIRFLPLDSERGDVPARLNFELACC
jgi:cell division protein ZapD